MATHADFYGVGFNEHLGNNAADLNVPWATFKGNASSVRKFYIDGTPLEFDTYLLMQVLHVDSLGHVIKINGVDLAGSDISRSPDPNMWNVVLDWIDAPLHTGENTIQIVRASGGDNFVIGNVFIHWREIAPSLSFFRWLPILFGRRSGRIGTRQAQPRLANAPVRLPARKSSAIPPTS